MSEFSQSLHLRSTSADDVVALLRRAKVPGVVMPPSASGWVTSYPPLSSDPFSGGRADLERILALGPPGPLVVWDFAEDHGLRVEVFEHGKLTAALDTAWETREVRRFDRATFVRLGLLSFRDAADVAAWLDRFTPDYLVAERMGLSHYRWADAERAWRAFDAGTLPAGARLVLRDGTVSGAAERESEDAAREEVSSRFDALADASVAAWLRDEMIALDGPPSAALRTALAELLASAPTPRHLEAFLLEHDEVAEVYGASSELAQAVASAVRSSLR